MRVIVGVAGKEVDQIVLQPDLGQVLGRLSEATHIRLRSYLDQASARHPTREQFGPARANWVPLRMRQDRSEPSYLDLVEDLIELLGHEVLVQLDQQVPGLVDGEAAAATVHKLLDVLVGKVKVAARQKLRHVADGGLELPNLGL